MLGFIIGAATGMASYWLLYRFTCAVTCGKINNKVILIAVSQLFLPLIVLVCCALLLHQSLLWVGVGIAASLIICAVARFLFTFKRFSR